MNMTHSAFSAGIPILAVPTQLEQRRLAERVEEFGIGLCLGKDDGIMQIRMKIKRVLDSSQFAYRSAILKEKYKDLTEEKGVAAICDFVDA